MGIFIFLVVVVVEIAFAVFCNITKSNHQKLKSIIRIAELIVFVILLVLKVINWNFSYYALAALLVLLAVMGLINLIREKEVNIRYKTKSIVLKAIGMTVVFFVVILPAIIFPQSQILEVTGEYQVATEIYTYTDTNRVETFTDTGENRMLNVQLWYPENTEDRYPLVVFSHGGISDKLSNESLFNELASNGYVVCSINHTYHCLSTTDEDGDTISIDKGYMKELSVEDAQANRQQSYEYYKKWMNIRTGDINFVIDYILDQVENNNEDTVYKLVDKEQIGVMGHSLGGSAALGIGRIRDDINGVIALESPFMYDIEGVLDGEFIFTDEDYPVPVLNVYSDTGWVILDKRPQYATNYEMLSDNDATTFNVYISGVGHFTLTDLALTSPILTRILNGQKSTTDTEYCLKTINMVSLEFLNSYLKGEGEFASEGTY